MWKSAFCKSELSILRLFFSRIESAIVSTISRWCKCDITARLSASVIWWIRCFDLLFLSLQKSRHLIHFLAHLSLKSVKRTNFRLPWLAYILLIKLLLMTIICTKTLIVNHNSAVVFNNPMSLHRVDKYPLNDNKSIRMSTFGDRCYDYYICASYAMNSKLAEGRKSRSSRLQRSSISSNRKQKCRSRTLLA